MLLESRQRPPGLCSRYQWLKVLGIAIGAGGAIVMTMAKSKPSESIDISIYPKPWHCDNAVNSTISWNSSSCEPAGFLQRQLNAPYLGYRRRAALTH